MRFFAAVALVSAALVSSVAADAAVLNDRHVQTLEKRQQFTPTTQTATGNTCADAFGAGYVICRDSSPTQNRLCYNPSAGQTCCNNQFACPSGSFCFTNGNCCPNGLSQSDCAAQLSAAAASNPTAVNTASLPSYSGNPWPASNGTKATGTGASSGKPAQFTGAASVQSLEVHVAALGGVVALLGALL